ncbi:MAG: ATP-binding protein [Paracoccaceae bacterium]
MNRASAPSIVDAIAQPALLIDDEDRIIGINAEAGTVIGSDVVDKPLITVLRHPSLHKAIDNCRQSRRREKTRIVIQQGTQDHSFTVSCAPIPLNGILAVLLCLEDQTQLEHAGQMRRDFVANVSHELRTPLTALIGFIETLQGPARNDPKAQERFLGIMQTEADRMNRLIKDLLSLSQVEGQERIRPDSVVDLQVLLTSTIRALTPQAEKNRTRVTLDVAMAKTDVTADEDQLRQVFTNLIENAIKYGGADGAVAITISEIERDAAIRGPAIKVAVRDTGQGIDPIHIPRLTERFYRVDSHRSREMGGTGLGLAIVKHIVSRHRGRLKIDSVPGQGSCFTVILPRVA